MFSPWKMSLTDASAKIALTAPARIGPTESTVIFSRFSASSGRGREFVMISSSIGAAAIRSTAGGERTPCEARARIERAPRCLRSSAAPTTVPAVSIMSSTMIECRFFTSPTTQSVDDSLRTSAARRL